MEYVILDETLIPTIDDQPINVEDLRRGLKRTHKDLPGDIIKHIIPGYESFYAVLLEVLLGCPQGILADADLNNFGYPPIAQENLQIRNGIHIAQFFYEFCPQMPIAVYSSHPDDFEADLDKLPFAVYRFKKTDEALNVTLSSFIERVIACGQKGFFFPLPEIKTFEELPRNLQLYYIKRANAFINADHYFEVAGDYRWFAVLDRILPDFHGEENIDPHLLSEEQKELKSRYGLKCHDQPNFTALYKRANAHKNNPLPFIFWNLRNPHLLNINLIIYNDCEDCPGTHWHDAFQIQVAHKLASFYTDGSMNTEDVMKSLCRLDDLGRFEFQKHYLRLNLKNKANVSEACSHLKPLTVKLKEKVTDYFVGRVEAVDHKTDTAWVTLENSFDRDAALYEPFSLGKLREYLPVVSEGLEFEYIIYKNNQGDDSVTIDPVR